MKPRVFLDTNVFIYAFEFTESNSAKILDMLNTGEIEVVISSRVFREIIRYFQRYYTRQHVQSFRRYLLESCTIVSEDAVRSTMEKFHGVIKDKDLEQLAVVKEFGIKYLIAYDRDFDDVEEYVTPKKFLELLHVRSGSTEY